MLTLLVFCTLGCGTRADSALESNSDSAEPACIATFGDHCGCITQCMTEAEIEKAIERRICSAGCGVPTWECLVVDGECVVDL